jgi:hypothetical protein
MPYTEPTLAWLENLNRARTGAPQTLTEGCGPVNGDAQTASLAAADMAGLEDELQKRLGEIVFSTLCEKLGRSALLSVESDIATTGSLTPDHLRAARALLNWSMSDLALESGLSISTIKRIELEPQDVTRRSYRLVVDTLRGGGIRFVALDGGTIAVAKASRAAPPVPRLPPQIPGHPG